MDHKILQYNLVRPTVSPPETDIRLTQPLFKAANPIAMPVSCQINPQSAFLHLFCSVNAGVCDGCCQRVFLWKRL